MPPIVIEASLPAGFPEPGPAGPVLRKSYPAYRAARANGADSFGQLFRHIQRHDIAMTAPVEMTLSSPAADDAEGQASQEGDAPNESALPQRLDMAFLYADPENGTLGPDQRVTVVDLPALEVLSVGFFGNADRPQIDQALKKLQLSLPDHPDWQVAGPPRLLGYNSPMIPEHRRYHEVQLPVRRVQPPANPDAEPPSHASDDETAAAPSSAQ